MVTSKPLNACFLLCAFSAGLLVASSTFQDETNPNAGSHPFLFSYQNSQLDHANDSPVGYHQNPPPDYANEPPAVSSPPPADHADNPPPVSYQNPPTNCDIPPSASGYNNPTPPPPTGYNNDQPPSSGGGGGDQPSSSPVGPIVAPSPIENDNPSQTPPFGYHFYPPPATTTPPSTAPSTTPYADSPSTGPPSTPYADSPSTAPSTTPYADSPSTTSYTDTPSITPPSTTPPVTGYSSPSPPSYPHTPFLGGTSDFWRRHQRLMSYLFRKWHVAIGGRNNTPWPNMSLQESLSNTRTDGIGALYREGTASLLNSMVNKNFPFTTSDVKHSFLAALRSNKAAAAQAEVFKLANEGRLE